MPIGLEISNSIYERTAGRNFEPKVGMPQKSLNYDKLEMLGG